MNTRRIITRENIARRKRGFSLFEVLIASSIFAIIMIISTEIFGMGSSYATKVKEMRKMGEGSRKLADMITDDIRQANTSGTIDYHKSDGTTKQYKFKNGIATVRCTLPDSNHLCRLVHNAAPDNTVVDGNGANDANALILFNKDWTKIYYSEYSADFNNDGVVDGYNLFYRQYAGSKVVDMYQSPGGNTTFRAELSSGGEAYKINRMVTGTVGEAKVFFNGFAPDDENAIFDSTHSPLQPYVNMEIMVRSASRNGNYDSLKPYNRAAAEIVTTVTSRSYNQ